MSAARITRVRVAPDGTIHQQRPDGTTEPLTPHADPARIAATTEAAIAAQAAEDTAAAARDAAAWARGVRHRLGLSQAEFARRIAVPVATLRNWEQGKRAPRGPARALLRLIDLAPEAALAALRG
ncbi:MAG: helix-turn-helix domain-containing protein [Acetobacteraceae bacterium]